MYTTTIESGNSANAASASSTPRFRTLAVHAGQRPDPGTGALATPIFSTSTFAYDDFACGARRFAGEEPGFIYSRFANPTVAVLEAKMAALEKAEGAVAFASGMAAICSTIFGLLSTGDELAYVGPLYGGTDGVFRNLLPRMGIHAVNAGSAAELRRCVTAKTRMIYVETPTNPTMDIVDLAQVAEIARSVNAVSVVDNTFATPYLTRPIAWGIDVCVHAATKYIGGHGDATGGIVAAGAALIEKIRMAGMKQFGGCMSPHEAYLFIRGLKTLPLRMDASCENASTIAQMLSTDPKVERVYYPGLASHPGHDVAKCQMDQYGGILSFELRGGKTSAQRFLDNLSIITQAVSVGDTDSLACHPASTTHRGVAPEIRLRQGVSEGLIRMSIGIEDPFDLAEDVRHALKKV